MAKKPPSPADEPDEDAELEALESAFEAFPAPFEQMNARAERLTPEVRAAARRGSSRSRSWAWR